MDVTSDTQFYKDNNIGAEYILTLNLKVDNFSAYLATLDADNDGAILAIVESGTNSSNKPIFNGIAIGKWGSGNVYLQTPSYKNNNNDVPGTLANGLAADGSANVAINGNSLDINQSTNCALSVTNMGAEFTWTAVESATITLYHQGIENISTVTMNLEMSDGTIKTITGATWSTDRAWDTYADATILKYNDHLVSGYTLKFIPEPATATLSLLALCGLAARRRRK